jgi:hypothetical protein
MVALNFAFLPSESGLNDHFGYGGGALGCSYQYQPDIKYLTRFGYEIGICDG